MLTPDLLLKALVDETRLRCLLLVLAEQELCVCEFGHALALVQPKISKHLALLRTSHVLQDRKEGQWVYYRLHPALPAWAMEVMQAIAIGAEGLSPYREDLSRLQTMDNRPNVCQVGCKSRVNGAM
ncbi:MAG: metalloregulator ArsR/SmtB family transcription factor [Magnetococcales bacterium]|nr:metalloregulator ArsR/SmtB family transcription factor [Magnetococcales bacterium]